MGVLKNKYPLTKYEYGALAEKCTVSSFSKLSDEGVNFILREMKKDVTDAVFSYANFLRKETGYETGFFIGYFLRVILAYKLSPIEALFWIHLESYVLLLDGRVDSSKGRIVLEHFGIYPETNYIYFEKDDPRFYRVDFCLIYNNEDEQTFNRLLVELDSRAFHDRSEAERAKEKARENLLKKREYTIFRYTGKDVTNGIKRKGLIREVVSHVSGGKY